MDISRAVPRALAGALTALLAAACTTAGGGATDAQADPPRATAASGPPSAPASSSPAPGPSADPSHDASRGPIRDASRDPIRDASAEETRTANPRTQSATMSIAALGLRDLPVVPYEGTTDDRAGTRIQDRGVAASPYGERGGVGPGEIGNYLVTAHRLSAGGPLRELPSLKEGDLVSVALDGRVYEYEITETRKTSFRSDRSLAEQRAAVPGRPGETPTLAMITISTCATPEDNAAGNFWRDENSNPEHRIDKIGVLRAGPEAP